jgi:mono/diheme cytochrome c family protein
MNAGLSSLSLRPVATTQVARGLAFAVALVLALTACERPPSADSLPEWTQSDHHSNDDNRAAMGAQVQAAPNGRPGAAGPRDQNGQAASAEIDQLVDLTWRQQCITCHGPMGHGDGQMGPMVQAPDLTLADWQAKITDAEMATLIKMGRNRMPAFNLPDPVLAGLVSRIRALEAR